jgi:hypothetical protein
LKDYCRFKPKIPVFTHNRKMREDTAKTCMI